MLPIGFLILMAGFPRMDRGFLLQLYRGQRNSRRKLPATAAPGPIC